MKLTKGITCFLVSERDDNLHNEVTAGVTKGVLVMNRGSKGDSSKYHMVGYLDKVSFKPSRTHPLSIL